jgi:hypothetical protein
MQVYINSDTILAGIDFGKILASQPGYILAKFMIVFVRGCAAFNLWVSNF